MPLNTSPGLSPQEQSLISAATPSSPSSSQASPPRGPQASSPSPSGSSSAYPSGIDQSVVALMHGIKSNEGANGNYNATGDKGTAAGIGMWSNETNGIPEALQPGQIPANFAGQAKQYGLDPTDFSPANQNQVMYSTLAADKKAGLTPEQILSKWNSGNPNAFLTNPVMKAATSSTGTENVASYVQRGMAAAQAYAKQNQQQSAQQTPSSGSPANNSIPTVDSIGSLLGQGNYMGALGKGAADLTNFAFPIVGDVINDIKGTNTKTGLQQAGDAGLSALSAVPGLGEVGDTLRGALGVGEGAGAITKLLTSGAAYGGLGYAGDVSANLSKGKTGSAALTPGLGTAVGAGLGAGGELIASTANDYAGRINNSLIKPLKNQVAYGQNPGKTVAEMGLVGNSLPDLGDKVADARKTVGAAIGNIAAQVKTPMDLTKSLAPLDDAMQQAAGQNNSALFNRIVATKQALMENLIPGKDPTSGLDAIVSAGPRDLKTATYANSMALKGQISDVTHWTGNDSDDKLLNSALQQVWKNVSEAQKTAAGTVSPELRAQLEKLNEQYGGLSSASAAIRHRIPVEERQNLVTVGDMLTGAATDMVTGGGIHGAAAGIGGALLRKAAVSTAAKTRLASSLARVAGYRGGMGLLPQLLKTAAIRGSAGQ